MAWRYQPVVKVSGEDFYAVLIEVYLDDNDRLLGWTEEPAWPSGFPLSELTGDLSHMLCDAMCWQPVLLSELKPGMTFKRVVTMEKRREIADMIDGYAGALEGANAARH